MASAWHLKSRPAGLPTSENFELKEMPTRELAEGEFRVTNKYISVDPYMRGRMNDAKSYADPFALDAPMNGGAFGEVTESKNADFTVGDKVVHFDGWRDETVLSAASGANKVPVTPLADDLWLGNMGMTGGTAYFGLLNTASAKEGDIVFVSAAAGAVGSAVVQIAKAKGMTVIGSAGGPEKCAWVMELGADACIDYKAGDVLGQLHKATPKGIDVYFDNVGGEHLDAAFATARLNARFAICGMIDVYNDGKPIEMKYLIRSIPARIRMEGFLFGDHAHEMPAFMADMGAMIAAGKVQSRATIMDGLESAPDAFIGLFSGQNTGKMLVKI